MSFKIDSHSPEKSAFGRESSLDLESTKQKLLSLLNDFPYETIHLEKDTEIRELLELIQDKIDIDLSQTLVKKQDVIDKINEKKQEPVSSFHNPAVSVLSYFDLASKIQEKKKMEQFEKLQEINNHMDLLGKLLSLAQTESSGENIDFQNNKEAQVIIDQIQEKFGLPQTKKPYVWENKQELMSYLNQKIKEQTHKSSESMVHLQHQADQLKSMVDITKEILKSDSELKEYIIRKTQS